MADFRRWILALAVLALFAGLASAQVNQGSPLACNVNASPNQMRAEGITELIGDIVITCTGGSLPANGTVQQVNITVTLPANVTSRLQSSTTSASEALLLIDEPGNTTQTGFGPAQSQVVCSTPLTGCPAIVATNGTNNFAANPAGSTQASTVPGGAAPNVYQGIVAANQVTFFGVPILPPVTSGARVLRITNVRMNANGAGASQVIASLAVSSFAVLPINTTVPPVGQIQNGLAPTTFTNAALTGSSTPGFVATSFQQCTSAGFLSGTNPLIGAVNFKEGFGSSFKTRVAPGTSSSGQTNAPVPAQNVPGVVYNSESGLIVPIGSFTAGLADFGTRLKATFTNIPAGVRVFVSLNNISTTAGIANIPAPPNNSTTSFATLVTGETVVDTTGAPLATASTVTGGPAGIPLVEITPAAGLNTATAVWEVINTNPFAVETFSFAVYMTFTSNTATTPVTPAAGAINVAQSFAPTSTVTTASTSAPVPRFIDTSTAKAFATIGACRTVLLFPFVTNIPGWDTGIAIANTTSDVFGTTGQTGTCQTNWYGAGATITPFNLGPAGTGTAAGGTAIAPGTVAAFALSGESRVSANFVGYMIAVCNFQFAHGYAFISDLGAQKWAQGYLALVLPDAVANGGSRTAGFVTAGGEELVH